MTISESATKVVHIVQKLDHVYSQNECTGERFIDKLMVLLLAGGSSKSVGKKRLNSIHRNFMDWNEVRVSRVCELADALEDRRTSGDKAAASASNVISCLQQLFCERGTLDLDPLAYASRSEIFAYIAGLDAVEASWVASLMSQDLGRPSKMIDGGVTRLMKRYGAASSSATFEECRTLLEEAVPPEKYYQAYHRIRQLAAEVCKEDRPRCEKCCVKQSCRFYSVRR